MSTLLPIAISTGLQLLSSVFKKPQKTQNIELRTPNTNLGSEITTFFGKTRLSGSIFFPKTTDKMYRVETKTSKGKGFSSVETQTVYATWATLFCANPCSLEKLIINGKHIDTSHSFYAAHCTFFDGTQTVPWSEAQLLYPGYEGDIAYTGLTYVGFKDVNAKPYGNTTPQDISAILVDARLGNEPSIGYVVQRICEDAGIPNGELDITEIIPLTLKTGLNVIQTGEGFRKAIEQLMEFYQFSVIPNDGKLKFKLFDRGNSSGTVINLNDFLPVTDDSGNKEGSNDRHFTRKQGDTQSLPNKILIKFFNQNRSYDQDDITLHFGEYTKEDITTIDTTLSTYPYEIEEKGMELLKMNFLQNRLTYSFRLPILYDNLELLDTVLLPNGETCQIQSKTNGNDFTIDIKAFYYSGQRNYFLTPPIEQSPDTPPNLADPTTLPDIYILDIPQIEDNPPATLYVLASLPATLNFSFDSGDSYPDFVNHLEISTIGDCDTALPNVVGLDITNTLDVTLTSGDIEQITQNQFDNGQNLALLGVLNPNGFYEGKLIRFRDITLLAPNQYRLSYLFQGDYDTSSYDTSSLPLKFFLLKAPTTAYYSVLVRNTSNLNSPLSVLPVVSQWQDLGSTPTTDVSNFNNNSYIPPAVTNITSEKDSTDPNTNISILWTDSYINTSPYKDGTEFIQYKLEIYSDIGYTTLVRTETLNETNYFYNSIDRIADGISLPFYVRVARISSIVGEGIATDATISNPTLVSGLSGTIDADLLQGELPSYYLDRTNHTGTQLATTVTNYTDSNDFKEAVDDRVDALLTEGTNISLTYDDTANTLTVANTQSLTIVEKTITANYTVVLTDLRVYLIADNTSDIDITLPNGLPDKFEAIVRRINTANVTFIAEAGGTIEGAGTIISEQYRTAHFYHSGGNVWRLTGFLT